MSNFKFEIYENFIRISGAPTQDQAGEYAIQIVKNNGQIIKQIGLIIANAELKSAEVPAPTQQAALTSAE